MRYWVGEIIISALCIVFGAAFFVMSNSFSGHSNEVGASFFPRFLSISLIFLSFCLVFKILKKHPDKKLDSANLIKVLGGIFICSLYVYLIPILGYLAATTIFAVSLMLYLGYVKILPIILNTVGFTALSYVIFFRLLGVTLPL